MNSVDILVIRVDKASEESLKQVKEIFQGREVWVVDKNVRSIFMVKDGYIPSVIKIFDLDEVKAEVSQDQTTIWDYLNEQTVQGL